MDVQKWIAKTGKEFHWPGYQYMGPGTHLAKRLKRGDPGINRLDQIAKQHDIDYSRAKNLQDKWKADTKMIQAIDKLPGKKTKTERVVKKIMQAKKRLKINQYKMSKPSLLFLNILIHEGVEQLFVFLGRHVLPQVLEIHTPF